MSRITKADESTSVADCWPVIRKGKNEELGPWVVGLYTHAYDVRFELVPNRSRNKLVYLVRQYVDPGSTVVTD